MGLMNGLALGLLAFATAWVAVLIFPDVSPRLPWVVLMALWGNIVVGSSMGAIIPTTLHRLGIDPAIASSVFLTTFTDMIGSGSHIRIASQPYCWYAPSKGKRAGVKLQPRNIFVYRCVSPEMQQSAAEIMGLTEEETSYVIDGERFDLTETEAANVADQEF